MAARKRARDAPSTPSSSSSVAPRPVRSAFAHFATFKRVEVASLHAQWTPPRVSTEVRRLWATMGDGERQPWAELADFDLARFQQENSAQQHLQPPQPPPPPPTPAANVTPPPPAANVTPPPPAANVTPPAARRAKLSNEPRQPDTPYICFWKVERPEVLADYPNMSGPNVSREVGLRWKALLKEERQVWIELAARDRERYEHEMAAYRQLAPLHEKAMVGSVQEVRPPKSAFHCFLNSNRESLALLTITAEAFKSEMSVLWKRMVQDEKQVWLDMAVRDQARYEAEMALLKAAGAGERARKRLQQLIAVAKAMESGPMEPRAAFDLFAGAKARDPQQKKATAKSDDVAKAWQKLPTGDKLPFFVDEQLDIMRFAREMDVIVTADDGVDDDDTAWISEDLDAILGVEALSPLGSKSDAPAPLPPPLRPSRKAKPDKVAKKPLTAFNMMYMAKREELMELYQLTQNECSALCGRMWRQMGDVDRMPYVHMASQDKERYARETKHTRQTKSRSKPTTAAKKKQVPRSRTNDSIAEPKAVVDDHRLRYPTRAHERYSNPSEEDDAFVVTGGDVSPGFSCYVESKRAERERWTRQMWIDDWQSLAAPHRELWEKLASDSHVPQPSDRNPFSRYQLQQYTDDGGSGGYAARHHRGGVDLDLLYGLVRGASSPTFGC